MEATPCDSPPPPPLPVPFLHDDEACQSSLTPTASIAESLRHHVSKYDEALYYSTRDYVRLHRLYRKREKRHEVLSPGVAWRYRLLEVWRRPFASWVGRTHFTVTLLLVLVSMLQIVMETTPSLSPRAHEGTATLWDAVEIVIACVFALDIVVHFALLPPKPDEYSQTSRRNFFRKWETWTDILTILPVVFGTFESKVVWIHKFEFLKALRILRLLRVLRQYPAIDELAFTVERASKPLIGPTIFFLVLLLTIGSAMFFAERGEWNTSVGAYLIDDCDCLSSGTARGRSRLPVPENTLFVCFDSGSFMVYHGDNDDSWVRRHGASLPHWPRSCVCCHVHCERGHCHAHRHCRGVLHGGDLLAKKREAELE